MSSLSIVISFVAFLVALYAAFVGPKFQLKLHVTGVIATKAKEANAYWGVESISAKKHIRETITSVIRTIQLIDKIRTDHRCRLGRSRDMFLTYFYLELYDSIHNAFMEPSKDPRILAAELFPEEAAEGQDIIGEQIATVRYSFSQIHQDYARKGKISG